MANHTMIPASLIRYHPERSYTWAMVETMCFAGMFVAHEHDGMGGCTLVLADRNGYVLARTPAAAMQALANAIN